MEALEEKSWNDATVDKQFTKFYPEKKHLGKKWKFVERKTHKNVGPYNVVVLHSNDAIQTAKTLYKKKLNTLIIHNNQIFGPLSEKRRPHTPIHTVKIVNPRAHCLYNQNSDAISPRVDHPSHPPTYAHCAFVASLWTIKPVFKHKLIDILEYTACSQYVFIYKWRVCAPGDCGVDESFANMENTVGKHTWSCLYMSVPVSHF